MKKNLSVIFIVSITILIMAFIFSACSRNKPAEQISATTTQEYSRVYEADIYGQWRYVKAVENGEIFYEEYASQFLNFYYIDNLNMLLETSTGVNSGYFYNTGENWFNFAFDAGPPIVLYYDIESKYLVWLDHTMEFYYEWAGSAGEPPIVDSDRLNNIDFFVDYALTGYWTFEDGNYIYAGSGDDELIIYCNVDMYDFIIYYVDYYNDKLITESEIFNQNLISTEHALIYKTNVSEGIPNEAFFFKTADGSQYSYIIQYSGFDGSIVVSMYQF